MAKPALNLSSNQPDLRWLQAIRIISNVCLLVVSVFALVMLSAWLIPAIGALLPQGWKAMKFNIVLCDLFSVFSLALARSKVSLRVHRIGMAFAIAVGLIASAVLYQYLSGTKIGIDTFLVSDSLSGHPGRMSPQSASSFLLLSIIMLCIRARKNLLSRITDGLTLCLGLAMLTFAFGNLYGVFHLYALTMENRIGPQTVFGLFLLTVVVFSYRAEYGAFSVLLADNIAGKTSRLAVPFTLSLPFLLAVLGAWVEKSSLMQSEYANAMATATVALLAFCLLLVMVYRIQGLEQDIRDLSLRDELTGLYNRRGFYVLASQALRLAQRSKASFSVLFFDMDNLKEVNDTLGHEMGSELLKEMASILATHFRETDVLARLGGDEFVVAGIADSPEIALAAERLENAAISLNSQPDRKYTVSFSYGLATSDDTHRQTLDELLAEADKIMYREKVQKRGSGRSPSTLVPYRHDIDLQLSYQTCIAKSPIAQRN